MGMCLTSSLATAAAGMISTTQDTLNLKSQDINRTNQQKNSSGKVRNNEVFCFSARNKNNKQLVNANKENANNKVCLLES